MYQATYCFGAKMMTWVPVLQAVTAIVHIGEARQLATLCDGALQLLDQESLEGKHVPGPKVRSSLAQGQRCSCGPASGDSGWQRGRHAWLRCCSTGSVQAHTDFCFLQGGQTASLAIRQPYTLWWLYRMAACLP